MSENPYDAVDVEPAHGGEFEGELGPGTAGRPFAPGIKWTNFGFLLLVALPLLRRVLQPGVRGLPIAIPWIPLTMVASLLLVSALRWFPRSRKGSFQGYLRGRVSDDTVELETDEFSLRVVRQSWHVILVDRASVWLNVGNSFLIPASMFADYREVRNGVKQFVDSDLEFDEVVPVAAKGRVPFAGDLAPPEPVPENRWGILTRWWFSLLMGVGFAAIMVWRGNLLAAVFFGVLTLSSFIPSAFHRRVVPRVRHPTRRWGEVTRTGVTSNTELEIRMFSWAAFESFVRIEDSILLRVEDLPEMPIVLIRDHFGSEADWRTVNRVVEARVAEDYE